MLPTCLTLLLLAATATAVNLTFSPASATSSPAAAPAQPLPVGTALVLLDQRPYNDSCSVPAWVRTDASPVGTTAALPTLVVADDFAVPAAFDACRTLTIDLGLFRAMGRSAAGARVPSRATLYVWRDAQFALGVGWDGGASAYASQTFLVPTVTQTWATAAYGYTVDTVAEYAHVESLRFVWPLPANAPVKGGETYWLAAAVAEDRAFNASDFSQNQPRWMVTTSAGLRQAQLLMGDASTQAYRVVDAQAPMGAAMFRTAPQLANWTTADAAEPYILPFLAATAQQQHSDTRQLALGVFASDCTVTSRDGLVAAFDGVPAVYVDATAQRRWATPLPAPAQAVPSPWPPTAPSPAQAVPAPAVPAQAVPSTSDSNITTVSSPSAEVKETQWVLVIAAAILVVVVLSGLLFLLARRHYRAHYTSDTYHELQVRAAPDDAAIMLDDDNSGSGSGSGTPRSSGGIPAEVAVKATYADHPTTTLVAADDDDPDVAALKAAHDEQTMTPVPLDGAAPLTLPRKKKKTKTKD